MMYRVHRSLMFEGRLRILEKELSKSGVLCSQDSHFREEAPHFGKATVEGSAFLKVDRRLVTYCVHSTLIFERRLRILEMRRSQRDVLCSQDSYLREEDPHFDKACVVT